MVVCVSFIVSLFTVKAFAPCVVKHAMMKNFIEKQMDFEMFQSKLIKKMIIKKLEMEIAKKQKSNVAIKKANNK
jgi:hypothetical protein